MKEKRRFCRVAVLMGGPSSERDVSLRSGAAVARGLRESGYEVLEVVVGKDGHLELPPDIDAAFVAMHGRFGEDGTIQAQLRERGIPHTGSSPEACARMFDKSRSKPVLVSAGIPTPAHEFLRTGQTRRQPLPAVLPAGWQWPGARCSPRQRPRRATTASQAAPAPRRGAPG